jgi:hypothetical protein
MSSFRDKTQIFLLGLMLGLLVGGGFFILKLDNYFRELSFYKSNPQEESSGKDDKKDDKQPAVNHSAKKKTETTTAGTEVPTAADSSLAADNAVNDQPVADTLQADSSNAVTMTDNPVSSDEIIVRKDEMLASRTVELINLNLTANAKGGKDSLQTGADPKVSYKVEYWKSPINYKGYKMTRNKLVLYGISSGDAVSLMRYDDDIYLKHLSTVYRLGYTNDFRQFEKVADPAVLSKLNK